MHIMLDLETMSLAKDAAIISIGAVKFDPNAGVLGDTFYKVVSLKSAQRAGGHIDAETVLWWMQQSDQARKALTGDDSVLTETALIEFAMWVRSTPLEAMWGNGSDFDNVVLENTYTRLNKTTPWSYKVNRCYRTLSALCPNIKREQLGTHHNALDDAISQAKHLCVLWKELGLCDE